MFHVGSVIDELERANFQNGNWIWELPSTFGHLVSLRHANLNENQLSYLPENFGNLVNLEWLDLGEYFSSFD
jgi:Leucine-rich repeat (LRR) protein